MTKFIHDTQPQDFYDAFNAFIMSSDTKTFAKLISKFKFIESTKDLPGDILELGVFKGSGLFGWLKSMAVNSIMNKRVIGFDLFDENTLVKTLSGSQAEMMSSLFENRGFSHSSGDYCDQLRQLITSCGFNNLELVKGDICKTLENFLNDRPGFRASVINFDLDVDEPTSIALELLWPRLVPNGIAIFDEYAIDEWDESNAVDRFITKYKLSICTTGFLAPTAYIVKPS